MMSSGKPRAPGPAQKCLFGSQQYLAQGKDVITGERDENRRTRAPGVSTEGSVPAGEAAPEGEGKRECGVLEARRRAASFPPILLGFQGSSGV